MFLRDNTTHMFSVNIFNAGERTSVPDVCSRPGIFRFGSIFIHEHSHLIGKRRPFHQNTLFGVARVRRPESAECGFRIVDAHVVRHANLVLARRDNARLVQPPPQYREQAVQRTPRGVSVGDPAKRQRDRAERHK